MNPNFQQIRSIFLAAVEKPAEARSGYLSEVCGADASLREQVELLLAAHDASSGILDDPTRADAGRRVNLEQEKPGTLVAGRYKLLEAIGEGGMGAVWVAEQTEPVRRKVALKLIKPGMDSRTVLARFEAERQALAMMDHPNIAKVLDGGIAESGRPYFVMEYVKGVPITEYCDAARLNLAQRLELFAQVCQAVQHAHQKGIIHRDLKPSNILVAPYDDKPVPKVIDFGLAKAMHQSLTEKTLHTAHETVLGTPLYMSPEQAQLNNLDVDTRSDIYSLGVLLYELLTGTTPLEKQRFKEAAWDEVKRIIREEEPPLPSSRLSTAQTLASLAAGRQIEPARLMKMVRGELDWIVMKALEKERNRRYETASGLAMDVRRYLSGEAVLAAPPTVRYRVGKFARKYRAALSVAAVIVILLIGGVAVSTWQAVRATRAEGKAFEAVELKEKALVAEAEQHRQAEISRQKAIDAANDAQAANEKARKRLAQVEKANVILASIFATLDPKVVARHDRPLQAILVERLDAAIDQLEGDATGEPIIVAFMQKTLGGSLLGLGEPQKAIVLLEKAMATDRAVLGPDDPETLAVMNHLALAEQSAGRDDLALPLLQEAYDRLRAQRGPVDEITIMAMNNLAQLYINTGKHDAGMALFGEALTLAKTMLGPAHIGTLTATNNLALAYLHDNKAEQALPLFEETLKLCKAKFGLADPQTLAGMDNLAGTYNALGRIDEAIALYEEGLKTEKVLLGPSHIDTLSTMNNLASAYLDAGKLELAMPLAQETLKLTRAKLGPDHPHTVACIDVAGRCYLAANLPDEALPLLEEALKREKIVYGPDDVKTLITMSNVARAYCKGGKTALAVPLFEEAIKGFKGKLGADNGLRLTAMHELGTQFWLQKRFDRSIPLYEELVKLHEAKYGRADEETLKMIGCLGQNYKDAGRVDEAVPLLEEAHRAAGKYPELRRFGRALLEGYGQQGKAAQVTALSKELLTDARETAPKDDRLRAGELASKGRQLLEKKSFAEAETLLRECLAIREKVQPGDWTTFNTQSLLGAALLGQKKYDQAEPFLLAGYEGLKKVEAKIFALAKDRLSESLQRLVELYESRNTAGDAEKAAKYRRLLENPAN